MGCHETHFFFFFFFFFFWFSWPQRHNKKPSWWWVCLLREGGRERERVSGMEWTENWFFFFFELFCQFYPWLLCNDFYVHCRFISWYEDKIVLLTYFEFCPLFCGFPIDHGSLFVFFFFKWRIIVGILWQSKG